MLESLQFVISFFQREPFGDERLHLGYHIACLAVVLQLRNKTAHLVPLTAAVFTQLLHGSLLSQNAPLPGHWNSKAFAQDLQIAQLVQTEGMAGQDPVVLQGTAQGVVDLAIRVLSFNDVQLALN